MCIRPQWILVAALFPLLGVLPITGRAQEKAAGDTPEKPRPSATEQADEDPLLTPETTEPAAATAPGETVPSTAETAAIMKEILSIRQMFGDLFEGTDVELSVLGDAAKKNPDTPHTTAFANELKRAISKTAVQPLGAPTKRLSSVNSPGNPEVTTMLRRMSRELDSQAADFEEQRRYDHADRLRGLAQQVRIQARVFEQPHNRNSITPALHPYGPPRPLGPATYPSANVPATSWRPGPQALPHPMPTRE